MSGWRSDELVRIGAADELHVGPIAADGTPRRPVTVWVVRAGDELYVRSWRGASGSWYRASQAAGHGHISAGGVETDVGFVPADESVQDEIDAAYRAKYGRYASYVEQMVAPQARATTLKLVPQDAR